MVGTAMNRLTRTPSVWLMGLTRELHTCRRITISPVCVSNYTSVQLCCQPCPLCDSQWWPGNSTPVAESQSVQSVSTSTTHQYSCIISHVLCVTHSHDQGTPHLSENRISPVCVSTTHQYSYIISQCDTVMTRELHTCCRIRISPVCVSTGTTHQYSCIISQCDSQWWPGNSTPVRKSESVQSVYLLVLHISTAVLSASITHCWPGNSTPVAESESVQSVYLLVLHISTAVLSATSCVTHSDDQRSAVS